MGFVKDTNKYPYKTSPVGDDYLIGSDSESNGATKSFKISDIVKAVEETATDTIKANKVYLRHGTNKYDEYGNRSVTLDSTGAIPNFYTSEQYYSYGAFTITFNVQPFSIDIDGATGVTASSDGKTITFALSTSGNTYRIVYEWMGTASGWNIIIVDWTLTVGTAPAFSSGEIGTVAENQIVLTYDEALDETSVPATTDFSTAGITGSPSITNVAVSATTVTLTLSIVPDENDTITVSYTSGANPLRDSDLNNCANLTNEAITNNVVNAPAFVSAEIGNVADDILVVVYDKAVNATTAGHNLDTDGSALSISSISSGSGTTTINFQLSRSVLDTETLNYDYSQASGATVAVTGGKELSEITNESVTNNVSASLLINSDQFTGTTINTAKWTVTDPSDTVTVSQNDQLIIQGDGSAVVSSVSNALDSSGKMQLSGTGTIQISMYSDETTYNASILFELKYADTGGGINRVFIGKQSGTGNQVRVIVTENGVALLDDSASGLSIGSSRRYRISYDGTNVRVDTWNGSSWDNNYTQAVSNTYFTGNAYAKLGGANNTGGDTKTHYFDQFYITSEVGYSTVVPS